MRSRETVTVAQTPELGVTLLADIRFPSPRANGIQVVKTAASLAEAGADVSLVVRRSSDIATDTILRDYGAPSVKRLTVTRLRVAHATGRNTLPRLLFLVQAIRVARGASRRGRMVFTRDLQLADFLVRANTPHVVYEAHAVEAMMYDERSLLYGTTETPDPKKRARIAAREERVWRGSLGFVATTKGILASFEKLHGPRARTAAIPNGCDVPPYRVFTPPRKDTAILVYAGQLYPWKGVDVLVRAFSKVSRTGARLVIIGGLTGERDTERVRELVGALSIADRVSFRGTIPQTEVHKHLEEANAIAAPFLKTAMTSEHTSPIKAFEAMAVGRALLISDTASTREIVVDGKTGVLIPPGDVDAWARAMDEILSDTERQHALARAAFDQAPQYSWDSRARQLLALMRDLES